MAGQTVEGDFIRFNDYLNGKRVFLIKQNIEARGVANQQELATLENELAENNDVEVQAGVAAGVTLSLGEALLAEQDDDGDGRD